MSSGDLDQAAWRQLIRDAVLAPDFRRATFGGAVRRKATYPWKRVVVRPVELRSNRYLQFSYFDANKDITKNFQGQEIETRLAEVLDAGFSAIHLSTRNEEIDVRT